MPEGTKKSRPRAKAKTKAAKAEVAEAPKTEERPAEKNYSVLKWHAMDMYQCVRCPWSTLNEDEMISHVAKHIADERAAEAKRARTRRIDTGLVGPSGGKIIREETIQEEE